MTRQLKLTPARRISNITDDAGATGAIYWQTARWLLAENLAVKQYGPYSEWIAITEFGARLATGLGFYDPEPSGA